MSCAATSPTSPPTQSTRPGQRRRWPRQGQAGGGRGRPERFQADDVRLSSGGGLGSIPVESGLGLDTGGLVNGGRGGVLDTGGGGNVRDKGGGALHGALNVQHNGIGLGCILSVSGGGGVWCNVGGLLRGGRSTSGSSTALGNGGGVLGGILSATQHQWGHVGHLRLRRGRLHHASARRHLTNRTCVRLGSKRLYPHQQESPVAQLEDELDFKGGGGKMSRPVPSHASAGSSQNRIKIGLFRQFQSRYFS
jgi:hypothetical protein